MRGDEQKKREMKKGRGEMTCCCEVPACLRVRARCVHCVVLRSAVELGLLQEGGRE